MRVLGIIGRIGAVLAAVATAGLIYSMVPRPQSPAVVTTSGSVQGRVYDEIAVYNGIPYAAAPVGPLRWRPPQPPGRWSGVRPADDFGPRCLQFEGLSRFTDRIVDGSGMNPALAWLLKQIRPLLFGGRSSEDCLYLNVRTPDPQRRAKLPVMVWFHGGSFVSGAGSSSVYNANGLPKRGVVVVTVNYRLGVLGYFAHPALRDEDPDGAVGNYGVRDQIAALAWVRDNIEAFGGDPNNVTIFGESAGGSGVGTLMVSPLSKGMFHRAISQSGCGAPMTLRTRHPVLRYQAAEVAGAAFVSKYVGVESPNLDTLRALDAQALVDAVSVDPVMLAHQRPAVDGHTLVESVGRSLERGASHPVPWILGWNADEGSVFVDNGAAPVPGDERIPDDDAEYRALLRDTFDGRVDEAVQLFPHRDRWRDANARLHGDIRFVGPCWWAAQRHAEAGHPTYVYYFNRVPPAEGQEVGAYHAAEIAFVFDSHPPLLPYDDRDDRLTREMGDYWAAFAKTGNPNHSAAPAQWTRFSAQDKRVLHLDPDGVHATLPDGSDRYDFLRLRMERLNRASAAVESASAGVVDGAPSPAANGGVPMATSAEAP